MNSRSILVVCCAVVAASAAFGQKAAPGPREALQRSLGDALFHAPELGTDGATRCATCHDERLQFADGRADAEGVMRVPTGRNSPTMFAIGRIERFRDPNQAIEAVPGKLAKTMSLEERASAPIANGLEMGESIDAAVRRLRTDPKWGARFDAAFGGSGGATKSRLGKALAAYLRSLDPPESPYSAFLRGAVKSLSQEAEYGRILFEGVGRCASCHSGPALSDGLMHVVDPPDGPRLEARRVAAAMRKIELVRREYATKAPAGLLKATPRELLQEADRRARELPGGGGYDAEQLEVQTTTLWQVAQTGPWFRDGSAKNLLEATRTHVRELRQVARAEKAVRATLATLDAAGKRAPISLRPKTRAGAEETTPSDLTESEVEAVVAFLKAL